MSEATVSIGKLPLLVHDVFGQAPERLKIEIENAGFRTEVSGGEIDVDYSGKLGLVVVSRDGKSKQPIADTLQRFRNAGFNGAFLLDVIHRRAAKPLKDFVDSNPALGPLWVALPHTIVSFQSPGRRDLYDQDCCFAPNNMLLQTILLGYAEEYLGTYDDEQRATAPIEKEPNPSQSQREREVGALKMAGSIVYRLPYEVFNARFIREECLTNDFEFFKRQRLLHKLVLYGHMSNIRRVKEQWDALLKGPAAESEPVRLARTGTEG